MNSKQAELGLLSCGWRLPYLFVSRNILQLSSPHKSWGNNLWIKGYLVNIYSSQSAYNTQFQGTHDRYSCHTVMWLLLQRKLPTNDMIIKIALLCRTREEKTLHMVANCSQRTGGRRRRQRRPLHGSRGAGQRRMQAGKHRHSSDSIVIKESFFLSSVYSTCWHGWIRWERGLTSQSQAHISLGERLQT